MKAFVLVLPLAVFLAGCRHAKNAPPTAPTAVPENAVPTSGGPAKSYPSDGPDVIAYVASQWPEKLAAGVSVEERIANMQFLRDRIIETGRCGGMDVGLNLKRGGPDISTDFIVQRIDGVDHGIDIGAAYDDTSRPLRLQWVEGEFPFYKAYPEFTCQ